VFDSTTYGRVLVLDGVIQLTERDEATYQEAIVHIPMMSLRRAPRNVMVVGGGDGGVVREVLKYPSVERVVQCEIDAKVVELAKKWFKRSTATSFDDPRLDLKFADAAVFLKSQLGRFDVIIVDSSDPVGPAETLFTREFFQLMYNALAPGGVVATQGECQFLHVDLIADTLQSASSLFPNANYCWTPVPTYPSGQIGFILCSKDDTPGMLAAPSRPLPEAVKSTLKHYSPELHRAAFVLPTAVEQVIAPHRGKASQKQAGGCGSASSACVVGGALCKYSSHIVVASLALAMGVAVGMWARKR